MSIRDSIIDPLMAAVARVAAVTGCALVLACLAAAAGCEAAPEPPPLSQLAQRDC